MIDNLPVLEGQFFCAFTAAAKTQITNASRSQNGVSCPTPPTDSLPPISPGQRKCIVDHYFSFETHKHYDMSVLFFILPESLSSTSDSKPIDSITISALFYYYNKILFTQFFGCFSFITSYYSVVLGSRWRICAEKKTFLDVMSTILLSIKWM